MTKKTPKKRGRKSAYDFKKIMGELKEYFEIEPARFEVAEVTNPKTGVTTDKLVEIANDFPMLEGFCWKYKYPWSTFHDWMKNNDELSDAIKAIAKPNQKRILITNALKNRYAQPFAIFAAKNILKWKDKHEHTGKDGKPIELSIDLTKAIDKVYGSVSGKSGNNSLPSGS